MQKEGSGQQERVNKRQKTDQSNDTMTQYVPQATNQRPLLTQQAAYQVALYQQQQQQQQQTLATQLVPHSMSQPPSLDSLQHAAAVQSLLTASTPPQPLWNALNPTSALLQDLWQEQLMRERLAQIQAANTQLIASQLAAATLMQRRDAAMESLRSPTAAAAPNTAAPSPILPKFSFEGDRLVPVSTGDETWVMSEYQAYLRTQLAFCETSHTQNQGRAQGRNKPIVPGQVGLICKHCAVHATTTTRNNNNNVRGTVYYPACINRIYQAAQNMATSHLIKSCPNMDAVTRSHLQLLRDRKETANGGKRYWADGCAGLGLYETKDGLRLRRSEV